MRPLSLGCMCVCYRWTVHRIKRHLDRLFIIMALYVVRHCISSFASINGNNTQ